MNKKHVVMTLMLACASTGLFSQDVNPFNGSLNYGAPILSVPSDRGNSIPITLSYGGNGINVMQPASEVGLGWGLSAGGSIVRNVGGIPDDFNGSMFDQKTKTFVTQRGLLSSQGPTSFDILSSRRNLDSTEFYFPNYDTYQVNGPGIGGSMTPMILNYMAFSKDANGKYNYDASLSSPWVAPQFVFNGDFSDTLISRHYPNSPVTPTTPFAMPKDIISGYCYNDATSYLGLKGNGVGTSLPTPGGGASRPGETACSENYNPTTNRLATSNYVEYFTNANGISAFKITNSAGYVYYYNLPVYSNKSVNYTYPLNNDYSVPVSTDSYPTDTKVGTTDQYYVEHTYPSGGGTYITEVKETNKIPVEWKLTAITGPDYVDVNGNQLTDDADKGYWVFFDYKLWTSTFTTRSPAYGFNYYYGLDDATANYSSYDVKKRSGKLATASLNEEEVYYLNAIQTSSHKAILIRDVRDDEVGSNPNYDVNATAYAASKKRMPQLYVKRVLLFNKGVISVANTGVSSSNTNFDFSLTTNGTVPLFNETWYQANKASLDAATLKGSVLEYDYSLATSYHRNINMQENATTRLSSPAVIQSSLIQTPSATGTGKLTLNKIIPVELQGTQLYPSIKFDYNATSSTDNPPYNPRKTDYWGFYKSDLSALGYNGYTTNTSKDYTDAWMLRKITAPLGGITEIEYESNSYSKVMKGNGGFRGPCRIYPIADISRTTSPETTPLTFLMEEGNNLTEDLAQVYNLAGSTTYQNTASSSPYSADVFLPIIQTPANPTNNGTIITNYFGALTYLYNVNAPLPIMPTSTEKSSGATIGNPVFSSCAPDNCCAANFNKFSYLGWEYTGNGWIRFNMPAVTSTVYGGGSRVKKVTSKNGTKDAYTTLYEYEDGVALSEADRFTNPVSRYASHSYCAVPEKLNAFGESKYDLAPAIGYTKSRVKNLGQVNAAQGWTEMLFHTSDQVTNTDGVMTNIDNFATHLSNTSSFTASQMAGTTLCSRTDNGFAIEYVDKFSPYWGLTKEQSVYDVNSNMLSKQVYEYETTTQGALVENFVFELFHQIPYWDPAWGIPSSCTPFQQSITSYETCIKHQYPAILKRTTAYGMGAKTITETVKRDEVTGENTITKTMGENNSSALAIKVPAFRISAFSNMGPKSVNTTWSNILGADAYSYSTVDSTIEGYTGQPSANFAGAAASIFSQTALTRSFNTSTNTYGNTSVTLPYWYQKSSYNWAGDVGSVDTYGLYKKSELTANPFNFATPSSNSTKWRFGSETSLMDDKGHTLETRSFHNKFSALRLDLSGKYLVSQAENCNYKSFTYTGFENTNTYFTDGEVKLSPGISFLIGTSGGVTPHTGTTMAYLNTTGMGPNYSVAYEGLGTNGEELGLLRNRVYRASVWVYKTSGVGARIVMTLDGSAAGVPVNQTVSMNVSDAKAVEINNWRLIYVDLKVPANYVSTGGTANKLTAYLEMPSGTGYFDDFQFHPVECSTASKVYDPVTGRIVADISAEGYATKYVYDAAGRLTEVYQEIPNVGLKLIKRTTYNYARGTN